MEVTHRSTTGKIAQRTKETNKGRYFFVLSRGPSLPLVHYQGGQFHPGLGRDHQLVTPVEFLAMLVPHIALRYEARIRTYGALSTTIRQ